MFFNYQHIILPINIITHEYILQQIFINLTIQIYTLSKTSNFNTNWLLSCHKDAKNKRIINNMILCSGSLIGGMNPFFQFTKLLITDDQWKNCWNAGFDQGDFNYIFYTKWQKFANFSLISTKLLTCEDRFMTLFYCMKPPVSLNGKNQIQSPRTNNTIIFMHQYNRFLNLSLFTNQICK